VRTLDGKRLLITGGTGSLGKILTRRIMSGEMGTPEKVTVFSRDEAKQHFMRLEWQHKAATTDEIIYQDFEQVLEFRIGDVRDFDSVAAAMRRADVVFNAAALKQVPACEYAPWQAVLTNIAGAENIVRAIQHHDLSVETVVGISTDKACKPVNVMGMTKAVQERVFTQANMRCPDTRFVCVRYGNVLASRGSVLPLFHEQIRRGGPVTITTVEMTRFLMTIDEAVDTVFAAYQHALPGEIVVPRAPAATVYNIAKALIGDRDIAITLIGIRPGEKIHEVMVSEEEAWRTSRRGDWYIIRPMLPELVTEADAPCCLTGEYSSADDLMTLEEARALLERRGLLVDGTEPVAEELLR
jgi:FlaA1/EpsC-like NDP-sugar epimerase